MQPALACVPELAPDLMAAWVEHAALLGLRGTSQPKAARAFLARWPDPQAWADEPLPVRLSLSPTSSSFLMFLLLGGHLRPGYDYLVRRKLSSFWRFLPHSRWAQDIDRFLAQSADLGFTKRTGMAVASQVAGRVLIQTGKSLDQITDADLADFRSACDQRQDSQQVSMGHYYRAIHTTWQILFHMGVLHTPPVNALTLLRQSFSQRMRSATPILRPVFVAYLDRLTATHARSSVSGAASRLNDFAAHLRRVDPDLATLADLDRRRHIETYLTATASAVNSKNGAPLSAGERRGRILTVSCLLNDITEWGWDQAPARRLVFRSDLPKRPRPLPRYLTPDIDRQLVHALHDHPDKLNANALLLARATGLRIGELVDLELDCLHQITGQGWWLKVPLGKLATERMIPLDLPTVTLVDQIVEHRSAGRPLPHPRTGRPTEFLLTHHGTRVQPGQLQNFLARIAADNQLPHITPHQLRHTYATTLVNAGISLQALMSLLGHVSAEMSLRYGRLFDATVRNEYETALSTAKNHLASLPAQSIDPEVEDDWTASPTIKTRLANGYCLRLPAQGACPHANICEHCPNLRTGPEHLPILRSQRADTVALARDAQNRQWASELARHRALIDRLDQHIERAQA